MSLHVYSLVGGLVPGSSEGWWEGVRLVDIVVLPMGSQSPSAPSVFLLNLPLGKIVGSEYLHVYWSSAGRTS